MNAAETKHTVTTLTYHITLNQHLENQYQRFLPDTFGALQDSLYKALLSRSYCTL